MNTENNTGKSSHPPIEYIQGYRAYIQDMLESDNPYKYHPFNYSGIAWKQLLSGYRNAKEDNPDVK